MNLLLSNDDGISATGLAALEQALAPIAKVYVVAPETEQSAMSHALTLHKPLRVGRRGEDRWYVSGTPADCVYVGIHQLLPVKPDLVISGINRGSNLGNDIFYSGTVAAALEGVFHHIPAIAISLHLEPEDQQRHYETAGHVARRVVEGIRKQPLPPRCFLNVNVPNVPLAELKGLRTTTLGQRHYAPLVDMRSDPRGRHYYWIGGAPQAFDAIDGTDGPAVMAGWATVTPLRPDLTLPEAMDALRTWTDA